MNLSLNKYKDPLFSAIKNSMIYSTSFERAWPWVTHSSNISALYFLHYPSGECFNIDIKSYTKQNDLKEKKKTPLHS